MAIALVLRHRVVHVEETTEYVVSYLQVKDVGCSRALPSLGPGSSLLYAESALLNRWHLRLGQSSL